MYKPLLNRHLMGKFVLSPPGAGRLISTDVEMNKTGQAAQLAAGKPPSRLGTGQKNMGRLLRRHDDETCQSDLVLFFQSLNDI